MTWLLPVQLTACPEKQKEKSAAEVGKPLKTAAGRFAALGKPVTDAVDPTSTISRRDWGWG